MANMLTAFLKHTALILLLAFKTTHPKAHALSLVMTATLLLPLGALGQILWEETGDIGGGQGLLGKGDRSSTEDAFTHQTFGIDYDGDFMHQTFGIDYDGNFTHQTFGNDYAPIGSGMLILLSAGIGYAATKRAKQNKRNQINKETKQ